MSDLTAGVASSPGGITPPLVGSGLPELTVYGAGGQPVTLKALTAESPTVLLYFRGGW
jgi:hypothetical protein